MCLLRSIAGVSLLVVALLLMGGCECGGTTPGETGEDYEVPFPHNDWKCNDDSAEAAERWITSRLPENRGYLPNLPPDIEPPHVQGPVPETPPAFVVQAGDDQLWIDDVEKPLRQPNGDQRETSPIWTGVEDDQAVSIRDVLGFPYRNLDEAWEDADSSTSNKPYIAVIVDEALAGRYVIELLDMLRDADEHDSPLVVFFEGDWPASVQPVPEPLSREYGKLWRDYQRQFRHVNRRVGSDEIDDTDWHRASRDAVGLCQFRFNDVYHEMERLTPEQRGTHRLEGYIDSWQSCWCRPDIEFLALSLLGSPPPGDASFAPVIDDDSGWLLDVDDELVAIDPEQNWGEQLPEQVDMSDRL